MKINTTAQQRVISLCGTNPATGSRHTLAATATAAALLTTYCRVIPWSEEIAKAVSVVLPH